jgi:hypothetical protein
MNIKLSVSTTHPETGARLASHVRVIHEDQLRETIDEILYSVCDHYTDTEAERRPVVTIIIEYL